jgi:hypothetical protein
MLAARIAARLGAAAAAAAASEPPQPARCGASSPEPAAPRLQALHPAASPTAPQKKDHPMRHSDCVPRAVVNASVSVMRIRRRWNQAPYATAYTANITTRTIPTAYTTAT